MTGGDAFAQGTTTDCSVVGTTAVAPTAYFGQSCDSVCSENTAIGSWTCGLESLTGSPTCTQNGPKLTIVTDFDADTTTTPHFSAYGECGSNKFCCIFTDDASPVGKVLARGTAYADDLHFDAGYPNTPRDLQPHVASTTLLGFQYGGAGNDNLEGSHFPDTLSPGSYRDNLYAEGGDDTVDGNQDGDYLSGGLGADTVKGDQDADTVVGGGGVDCLSGSAADDCLCDDANGGGSCSTSVPGNVFIGGDGTDTLWYAYNNCATSQLDTVQSGTVEVCGPFDAASHWLTAELPGTCAAPFITTQPSCCTDPN